VTPAELALLEAVAKTVLGMLPHDHPHTSKLRFALSMYEMQGGRDDESREA